MSLPPKFAEQTLAPPPSAPELRPEPSSRTLRSSAAVPDPTIVAPPTGDPAPRRLAARNARRLRAAFEIRRR